MHYKLGRWPLLLIGVLATSITTFASDNVASVYRAILKGEYDQGANQVRKMLDHGEQDPALTEVEHWLSDYRGVTRSRDDLRQQTFAWNVQQAKDALATTDGDPNIYLALCFASQAAAYADDKQQFGAEPWVRELAAKARAEAASHEAAERWSKAHAFYSQLLRIYEDDQKYEDLRDSAMRHARIELIYEDEDELERRIKAVDLSMLESVVRLIHKQYYESPDFHEMALGALNNLESLAKTSKLHEFLHGLANPHTREFFLKKLAAIRKQVNAETRFTQSDFLDLFSDIQRSNRESIELPEGLLVVEFLEGALQELDTFTSMVWPVDAKEFDKMMMGGFEGVGIQLSVDEHSGRLKVVTPLEDSPALEAGIQPDDLIVRVDGESTKGWTTDDAVRNIMGPAGSKVVLTMFRPSTGEQIPFEVERRNIRIRTVRGIERQPYDATGDAWNYMLDDHEGIAYIRLTGFHPDSQEELDRALRAADAQGMRGLILDLRNNPGGLLEVAVSTVSTFLREGEVVSTNGRRESRQSIDVIGGTRYPQLPLVVLVNGGSASASEILAGALQDHDRAIVLGERTFGKGSVQRVMPLGRRARLKLTTALYYLPSGRTPHKDKDDEIWGVDPDRLVELTPKEFGKVIERERETYIIHNEPEQIELSEEELKKRVEALKDDEEDEDEPPLLSKADIALLEADPFDAPDVDPQLETALLQLRVKLAGRLPWPRNIAANTTAKPGSD